MSSELLPKIKILLFLREADEQMKHLELLLTIFFWVRSIGNLWDVWQHIAKEAMNLPRKLMSLTNYWYVIGFRANNRQRVIGAFCNFHVNSKQRETKGVSGREALRDDPNNGCEGDYMIIWFSIIFTGRSLLWIREFDWPYYRFLSADRKQLRISAHRAPHLNLK